MWVCDSFPFAFPSPFPSPFPLPWNGDNHVFPHSEIVYPWFGFLDVERFVSQKFKLFIAKVKKKFRCVLDYFLFLPRFFSFLLFTCTKTLHLRHAALDRRLRRVLRLGRCHENTPTNIQMIPDGEFLVLFGLSSFFCPFFIMSALSGKRFE